MKLFKRLFKFIKYYIASHSANKIHSPFVFDLYTNVITDQNPFYVFDKIEDLRLILENDSRKIMVTDFGAGKTKSGEGDFLRKKSLKGITRKSATATKFGQLLFRLVNKFQPNTILEIGTSLGLGTMYLATPNKNAKVITMEGCKEISKIAKLNFEKLGVKNVEQVTGNFEENLVSVLKKITQESALAGGNCNVDFVFFDGNHRKEATLNYFELCLGKSSTETIFVFDDIHWSDEMEEAWEEIKRNQKVKVTIDLFQFGIVFFRKELTKEDFVLRF